MPSKLTAFTSQPWAISALSVSREEHQCNGVPPYFIYWLYSLVKLLLFANPANEVGVETFDGLVCFALRLTLAPANNSAFTHSGLSVRQAKCNGVYPLALKWFKCTVVLSINNYNISFNQIDDYCN